MDRNNGRDTSLTYDTWYAISNDGEVTAQQLDQAIEQLKANIQMLERMEDSRLFELTIQELTQRLDRVDKLKAAISPVRPELPAIFGIAFYPDHVSFSLGSGGGPLPWTVPNSEESEAVWEALVALYAKTTGREA